MTKDVECPRCKGDGWTAQRKVLISTVVGLYEVDCPECDGTGVITIDLEDQVEDWMRDEDE